MNTLLTIAFTLAGLALAGLALSVALYTIADIAELSDEIHRRNGGQ